MLLVYLICEHQMMPNHHRNEDSPLSIQCALTCRTICKTLSPGSATKTKPIEKLLNNPFSTCFPLLISVWLSPFVRYGHIQLPWYTPYHLAQKSEISMIPTCAFWMYGGRFGKASGRVFFELSRWRKIIEVLDPVVISHHLGTLDLIPILFVFHV